MDEISQLYSISEQKIEHLNKLREDCDPLEPPAHGKADGARETRCCHMIERIDEAIKLIKSNHELMPRILGDLKGSLDVVSSGLQY